MAAQHDHGYDDHEAAKCLCEDQRHYGDLVQPCRLAAVGVVGGETA